MPVQADDQRKKCPLAYLLTIRNYGTWVHGDECGSVDEHHNTYGEPMMSANPSREAANRQALTEKPTLFTTREVRQLLSDEIHQIGEQKGWKIWVQSVQRTHIHVVASTGESPTLSTGILKARLSLALHRAGFYEDKRKIWAEGSSGRYLWTENRLQAAIAYVSRGQSLPSANFVESKLRRGKKVRDPIAQSKVLRRDPTPQPQGAREDAKTNDSAGEAGIVPRP